MEESFIRKFREILRMFDQELYLQNQASCCSGISLAQCHTLLEIEKQGELSVSDLANSLDLDKSTVSRTVEGLVNIRMVNRTVPKENRRLALIDLTASGKQVCSAIHSANDSYIQEVLRDFKEEERKTFLNLFGKLTRNMSVYRTRKKQEDDRG